MSSLCPEPSWRPLLTQLTPVLFSPHLSSSYGTCIDNGRSMRTEEGAVSVSCALSNAPHSKQSIPFRSPNTNTKTPAPYLHSFPRSTQSINESTFASPRFCLFTPFHSERVFYSYPTTLHISLLGSYHLWVKWSESGGILLTVHARTSASQAPR